MLEHAGLFCLLPSAHPVNIRQAHCAAPLPTRLSPAFTPMLFFKFMALWFD
jgi:hypothetical protein